MEIRERIKAVGLKATPQRRLVYQTMQKLCHTGIEEVITRVQAVSPDVTVSTIYRIMDSFCAAGLISRFNHPDGKTHFDITPRAHHHIFTSDNRIIDFEDEEMTALIARRLEGRIDTGETIGRISIQITTQSACATKTK